MKKIFFALVALICSMSTNAQIKKIMKDGKLVATYKASQANQVVFDDDDEDVTPSGEHENVDLGLPSGLKWATCNIGADNPEDYGYYFAWGETAPKSTYEYKWYKEEKVEEGGESLYYITKYCTDSDKGIVDNKTVLDPEDDAAHVNWGGNWRMPTLAEIDELCANCTWIRKQKNGINGYTVIGPNENAIFLPCAGYWSYGDLKEAGLFGHYWSSLLAPTDCECSSSLIFYREGFWGSESESDRTCGFSVRPVCP